MVGNDQPGSLFKERIPLFEIDHIVVSSIVVRHVFGQQVGGRVGLLRADILTDIFYFGRVYKSALYTSQPSVTRNKHISFSYQLVGTRCIENGSGVDHRCHFKGDSCWEVGLDTTRDNIR